jgi:hypothetical protein
MFPKALTRRPLAVPGGIDECDAADHFSCKWAKPLPNFFVNCVSWLKSLVVTTFARIDLKSMECPSLSLRQTQILLEPTECAEDGLGC